MTFHLKIVTPDGLVFEGEAEKLIVRTTTGDMAVLAHHIDCVVSLGMGKATVVTGDQRRYAACIGGMLSVISGQVTLVPTTFEWAEDIDVARAQNAYDRAQQKLHSKDTTNTEIQLCEAKLKRALVRKSVASQK